MSFAPAFAPDAESEWRALDFELQELVLDEVDRLAGNPPPTPRGTILHDLVHDEAGVRHYVFLRLVVDRSGGTITVIGVVHYARPIQGGT